MIYSDLLVKLHKCTDLTIYHLFKHDSNQIESISYFNNEHFNNCFKNNILTSVLKITDSNQKHKTYD